MNNPHLEYTEGGLTMPDLRPNFRHLHWRVMGHSFGHEVASDWADKSIDDPVFGLYKNCGLWTMGEAAILYNVAKACPGNWLDIGAHTGWTTKHIAEGCNGPVFAIDPMFAVPEFHNRHVDNVGFWGHAMTSQEFFSKIDVRYRVDGVCIDGDHEPGAPLLDAQNAAKHLADTGVIMLHDGVGKPVQEAVEWLMANGFNARAYFTPHLVFCCWRGDFAPPDHIPDPEVKRQLLDGRFADFPWEKMQ